MINPVHCTDICISLVGPTSLCVAVRLQLEHVFGYNGPKNIQPNTFYTMDPTTKNTEVLYYTSAVAIIYEPVWTTPH